MMHIYKYIFICFTLCVGFFFFCVTCVMFSVSIDVIHI